MSRGWPTEQENADLHPNDGPWQIRSASNPALVADRGLDHFFGMRSVAGRGAEAHLGSRLVSSASAGPPYAAS